MEQECGSIGAALAIFYLTVLSGCTAENPEEEEILTSTSAAAVEPTSTLRVSKQAFVACLQAFRSQQLEKQLEFFEGMAIFKGLKKQVRKWNELFATSMRVQPYNPEFTFPSSLHSLYS